MKEFILLAVMVALSGCGTQKPILYPNAHLYDVGNSRAEQDIAECNWKAEQYVKSHPTQDVARDTVVGGAAGAVIGVVGGAVTGSPGTGAAVGAASGATAGLLHNLFKKSEPSSAHKQFVEKCLREKGYEPIGWE